MTRVPNPTEVVVPELRISICEAQASNRTPPIIARSPLTEDIASPSGKVFRCGFRNKFEDQSPNHIKRNGVISLKNGGVMAENVFPIMFMYINDVIHHKEETN